MLYMLSISYPPPRPAPPPPRPAPPPAPPDDNNNNKQQLTTVLPLRLQDRFWRHGFCLSVDDVRSSISGQCHSLNPPANLHTTAQFFKWAHAQSCPRGGPTLAANALLLACACCVCRVMSADVLFTGVLAALAHVCSASPVSFVLPSPPCSSTILLVHRV